MKIFVLMLLALFITSAAFAEVIYLKNGNVVYGIILDQDESSITIKNSTLIEKIFLSDIKEIKSYEDIKNENDVYKDAMFDLDEAMKDDFIDVQLGPRLGIFSLKDKAVSQYHNTGALLGLGANLWIRTKNCLELEFESYNHNYTGSKTFNNVAYPYSENLSLMPVFISYMHRSMKDSVFIGAGFGMVMVNKTSNFSGTEETIRNNFYGYQLMTGLIYKKFGVTLKYSNVETDGVWENVNFGGYSAILGFYF
jgi:opacity protein-like surface antigen